MRRGGGRAGGKRERGESSIGYGGGMVSKREIRVGEDGVERGNRKEGG